MKLLLVEDEPTLQAAVARALRNRGMDVLTCGDGAQVLGLWRQHRPDAVVLDLSLPHVDGLQVLEQARAAGLRTPVLILTARGTVGDRVIGLNTGADDYLSKPFDLDELEARLRALVRRAQPAEGVSGAADIAPSGPNEQTVGNLRHDRISGAVYHRARVLELTPRELTLLQTLMATPGHAVAKERLFTLVFPGEVDVQYEAIEVVVYRLRKKLADTGTTLMTLRGLGYLLKAGA